MPTEEQSQQGTHSLVEHGTNVEHSTEEHTHETQANYNCSSCHGWRESLWQEGKMCFGPRKFEVYTEKAKPVLLPYKFTILFGQWVSLNFEKKVSLELKKYTYE